MSTVIVIEGGAQIYYAQSGLNLTSAQLMAMQLMLM